MKTHATVYSGFRRIADPTPVCKQSEECLSPEHNPPRNVALGAGTYEYTCPNCGHVTIVTIPQTTC